MFSAFLSRDMTYSCGIFPELDKDLRDGSSGREDMNGGIGLKRIGGKAVNGVKELVQDGGQVNGNGNGDDQEDPLEQAQIAKIRYVVCPSRREPHEL